MGVLRLCCIGRRKVVFLNFRERISSCRSFCEAGLLPYLPYCMSENRNKTLQDIAEHTKITSLVIITSDGVIKVLSTPVKAIVIVDSREYVCGDEVLIYAFKTRKSDLLLLYMTMKDTLPYHHFVIVL